MQLSEIVFASHRVAETRSRLEKISTIALVLRLAVKEEIEIAVAYLSGELPQGKIGIGGAMLRDAFAVSPGTRPELTLIETDRLLEKIAATRGAGMTSKRRELLTALFSRATHDERDFLLRLIIGELRQGALEGIMLDAIAKAAQLPAADVRRAVMLAGSAPIVARTALLEGQDGLARFSIRAFSPVLPMLAQSAEDVTDALRHLNNAAFEWKLDGARVQAHKRDGEVRVYTRNLNEVTSRVPEIVEQVSALSAREVILDGEAIALKADRSPQPFQVTMQRFGRKTNVIEMRKTLPLDVFFFDILYLDGEALIGKAAGERFAVLERVVPPPLNVPRLVTQNINEAEAFLDDALAHGHEGLMAKDLGAEYEAGRRGSSWVKIKRALSLDLVVLAAEWGHGRRHGYLSNLHLGARDPENGEFVMLGKTFKGMTDEMLAWQTEKLLQLETSRDAYAVYVRPELVVEIALDTVQASSQYPGGLALRFARVKAYRTDKRPDEADTIETVRAIYARRSA
ncbi:MAG: ATP-dependent DNA ligase [Burkholderiales bacterium]